MKVDRNRLVNHTVQHWGGADIIDGGVPLRLEIASRFYASAITLGVGVNQEKPCAYDCLRIADTLINAHNATCGEVAGE